MAGQAMVPLTTVPNAFAARVLAARLGAEGILWSLRGNVDGPYPVGEVVVLVDAADLAIARGLLLADEIEATFEGADPASDGADLRTPRELWFVVLAVVALAAFALARSFSGA